MMKNPTLISRIITIIIGVAVLGYCVVSLEKMRVKLNEENSVRLEDAVKRAASTCYSMEGYYPATMDYLIENYGVHVDSKKYHVFYEAVGSNMQPEIKVYRR